MPTIGIGSINNDYLRCLSATRLKINMITKENVLSSDVSKGDGSRTLPVFRTLFVE